MKAQREPASPRVTASRAVTRRFFLGGTGAVAGSLAMPLAALSATPPSIAAPPLTAQRQRSYIALIDVLTDYMPEIDRSRAAATAQSLAESYPLQLPSTRAAWDAALDALDSDQPGSFALKGRRERAATIGDAFSGLGSDVVADQACGVLVSGAVQLAAAPFYPPYLQFEPATAVTLMRAK